jgi:hypothetical protein
MVRAAHGQAAADTAAGVADAAFSDSSSDTEAEDTAAATAAAAASAAAAAVDEREAAKAWILQQYAADGGSESGSEAGGKAESEVSGVHGCAHIHTFPPGQTTHQDCGLPCKTQSRANYTSGLWTPLQDTMQQYAGGGSESGSDAGDKAEG